MSRYHSPRTFAREHGATPSPATVRASCEWLAGESADALGQAFAVLCHPHGEWGAVAFWHREADSLASLASDWARFARRDPRQLPLR